MTFWEEIYQLRNLKQIPRQWSRTDIRRLLAGHFKPNTINSLPSNQSMTRNGSQRGDYVWKGTEPKAWRVGDGLFELIEDPEDSIEVQRAQREEARRICGGGISKYEETYPNAKPTVGVERLKVFAGSKQKREELVAQHIENLCREFTTYVEIGKGRYTGPSVYFHLETVDRFKELGNSVSKAATDDRFCELLYATLVAWGMHSMRRGPEMPDFETFARSIRSLAPEIEELSRYRITTLSAEDEPYIVRKLWSLITRLEGSATNSKLVANSKILHHLLLRLVPPIDRNNEALFFNCNIQGREEKVFKFIFPRMVFIAKNVKATLDTFVYDGFNSSETKVIDNAIIGYVLKNGLNVKGRRKKSTAK